MAYKVEFLPQAAREFEALDGSLRKIAAKQIDKLAERPELGEPGLVVLIIGIGKRERAEIYREVARRLGRLG